MTSFVTLTATCFFYSDPHNALHICKTLGVEPSKTIMVGDTPADTLMGQEVSTVKPVYNEHPRYPKIVVVVYRWSLFRGHLYYKSSNWDHKMLVVIDRWSLYGGGR